MKKIYFLLFFGLLINSNLEAKRLPGQIVFPNETIEATIDVPIIWGTNEPDFYALQQRVSYFVNGERKRLKVKPEEAKEIRFEYEGLIFQMLSVRLNPPNSIDFILQEKKFLKVEIEGSVSLLAYYQSSGTAGNGDDDSVNDGRRFTYILKKSKLNLIKVNPLSFRRDMSNFFADCITLVEKTEQRELKMRDIIEIVEYYNEVCGPELEPVTEPMNSIAPIENKETISNKITPFLLFEGRAEEAMNFYETLFEEAEITSIERYENSGETIDGKVYIATMQIHGQELRFIDSSIKHDFTFTPAISFFINCDSELEIYKLFVELSKEGKVYMELDTYDFSEKFGWVEDQFGVSWQLNFTGE